MRHIVVLGLVGTLLVGLVGNTRADDEKKKKSDPNAVELFDGKSLAGWGFFLVDPDAKMEDVWSVEDGILICKGEPHGYLATQEKFENFRLLVTWRWAPGKEPGNSGVLLRIGGDEKMMLPNCIEAQLRSGDAGNLYGFQGCKIDGDPDRKKLVPEHELAGYMTMLAKIEGAEKEPGQWNHYRIIVRDCKIKLVINDKLVNEAHDCDVRAGKIGLQSEGGEIHFKRITLIPLD